MAAIAVFILKTIAPIAGLIYAESKIARALLPTIYASSSHIPFLPRCYLAVVVVNVVATQFFLIFLGAKVGQARSRFVEKAKKDGDQDAEARFKYPKLYAEGFSEHAHAFNCIQRAHQHALETYSSFLALAVIGGIRFPLSSTAGGILWLAARSSWASGYSSGDPSKRYGSILGFGIWTSLLVQTVAAVSSMLWVADMVSW